MNLHDKPFDETTLTKLTLVERFVNQKKKISIINSLIS